jgi:L-lactate dehydrogenase complex protein LldE
LTNDSRSRPFASATSNDAVAMGTDLKSDARMQVGLFIPCYMDQLFPHVGMATVAVLERYGVGIEYPSKQTCCGQPMANAGLMRATKPLALKFFRTFKDYEYVVCPSGSCTSMVRMHYDQFLAGTPGFEELKNKTFELCEFITDVLKIDSVEGAFPHKVGLHQSCHGLRHIRLGSSSERVEPSFSKARQLLESLDGIELTEPSRPDECCGFGGTFSITEEAASCMMGRDRISDHLEAGTEILTSYDISCLMHLDGLMKRNGQSIKLMHVAEILAGAPEPK